MLNIFKNFEVQLKFRTFLQLYTYIMAMFWKKNLKKKSRNYSQNLFKE